MADNITALANTGTGTDVFATDDIGGVNYPRTKVGFGDDGSYTDASATNPLPVTVAGSVEIANDSGSPVPVSGPLTDEQLRAVSVPVDVSGELVEAIEAMRMAVQALNRSIGQMMPDTANRMRVNVEAGTLPTVTTVGTVSTMTNQTQVGSFAATEQIPSLMRLGADSTRRNISVT
jgi:hypothetical protein